MIIDLGPAALHVGGLVLLWSGLFTIVSLWVWFEALEGRQPADVWLGQTWASVCVIGAALLGARLAHAAGQPSYYLSSPLTFFAISDGGLQAWAGLLIGLLVAIIIAWRSLDQAAVLLAFLTAGWIALAVGAVGSVAAGDAPGVLTSGWWSFIYISASLSSTNLGLPTQPYPIYKVFACLLAAGAAINQRVAIRSRILSSVLLGAGLLFVSEFARDTSRLAGMTPFQLSLILMAALVVVVAVGFRQRAAG